MLTNIKHECYFATEIYVYAVPLTDSDINELLSSLVAFSYADKIHKIELINCALHKFKITADFSNLHYLTLSYNKLHSFPDIARLPALLECQLEHNQIMAVGQIPASLKLLNMKDNPLCSLGDLNCLQVSKLIINQKKLMKAYSYILDNITTLKSLEDLAIKNPKMLNDTLTKLLTRYEKEYLKIIWIEVCKIYIILNVQGILNQHEVLTICKQIVKFDFLEHVGLKFIYSNCDSADTLNTMISQILEPFTKTVKYKLFENKALEGYIVTKSIDNLTSSAKIWENNLEHLSQLNIELKDIERYIISSVHIYGKYNLNDNYLLKTSNRLLSKEDLERKRILVCDKISNIERDFKIMTYIPANAKQSEVLSQEQAQAAAYKWIVDSLDLTNMSEDRINYTIEQKKSLILIESKLNSIDENLNIDSIKQILEPLKIILKNNIMYSLNYALAQGAPDSAMVLRVLHNEFIMLERMLTEVTLSKLIAMGFAGFIPKGPLALLGNKIANLAAQDLLNSGASTKPALANLDNETQSVEKLSWMLDVNLSLHNEHPSKIRRLYTYVHCRLKAGFWRLSHCCLGTLTKIKYRLHRDVNFLPKALELEEKSSGLGLGVLQHFSLRLANYKMFGEDKATVIADWQKVVAKDSDVIANIEKYLIARLAKNRSLQTENYTSFSKLVLAQDCQNINKILASLIK